MVSEHGDLRSTPVTYQSDGTGITANVEAVPNSVTDPSDPLYSHPSDIPGAIGECKRPDPQSPKFRQWERCDDMVTSWILNSLSKEIADSVEYANDKEINDLSQGTLDITNYYTQLNKLWEELSTLSAKTQYSYQCTSGAKENIHKAEQDRRLIQFLMELNEVYTAVRGRILMMNLLSSMAQAFSLLIQYEKQREMKLTNHLAAESVSLHVNTSGNANSFGNNNFRTNYAPNANYPNINRTRPFCDYCKRLGHTIDKCFKLHGYPQGHNQAIL
ncbi:PREDICTED: uncharacterized protein LOC109220046 [Nicotiana attenuata]|uniref:uncharacterized protein LOC109220046 n=1 Tax=Nicotiana attenuata TaxID=49451 RepID=UPI000904DA91|nr:PREDICTED: uncharacterized protein LOC109220046 [Nicotiana attenuata]